MGGQEVVASGCGASKNVVSTCSGEEVEIEKADGSSWQKEHDFVVIDLGSIWL